MASIGFTYLSRIHLVLQLRTLPLFYPIDSHDDQPTVRVVATVSNASGDGFYRFDSTSFVVLDPPSPDFYECFNAIIWTISLRINSQREVVSTIISVTEKNPWVSRDEQFAINICAVSGSV